MIYHFTEHEYGMDTYYLANINSDGDRVLVGVGNRYEDVRVVLNVHEAEHLIALLRAAINKIKLNEGKQSTRWIGVDLDGTLAEYIYGDLHRNGVEYIGPPIAPMVVRVKLWLAEGKRVKIFTARVSEKHPGDKEKIVKAIQTWCETHIGQVLEVTNVKDYDMDELWDDRAVQVRQNTGFAVT